MREAITINIPSKGRAISISGVLEVETQHFGCSRKKQWVTLNPFKRSAVVFHTFRGVHRPERRVTRWQHPGVVQRACGVPNYQSSLRVSQRSSRYGPLWPLVVAHGLVLPHTANYLTTCKVNYLTTCKANHLTACKANHLTACKANHLTACKANHLTACKAYGRKKSKCTGIKHG
jgi:hypothetical protein